MNSALPPPVNLDNLTLDLQAKKFVSQARLPSVGGGLNFFVLIQLGMGFVHPYVANSSPPLRNSSIMGGAKGDAPHRLETHPSFPG